MLITQEEAESYEQTASVTTLYALNENIHTTDYRQVYQGMYAASTADTKLIYNSKVYDSHGTDFGKMASYAGCFALAAGIFVTAAVYGRISGNGRQRTGSLTEWVCLYFTGYGISL